MDDGGLVLLSERTGKLHRCNATAAALWQALLDFEGHPERAAAEVAARYRVDGRRVSADLRDLLDALQRAGLVGVTL